MSTIDLLPILTTTVTLGEFSYRCHTNSIEEVSTESSRFSGAVTRQQGKISGKAKSSSAAASSSSAAASSSAAHRLFEYEHLADQNLYRATLQLEARCWKQLVGRKGNTRKLIEQDFNVSLLIPRPDASPDTPVYLQSGDTSNLSRAIAYLETNLLKKEKVVVLNPEISAQTASVAEAKKQVVKDAKAKKKTAGPPTHFLSLPMQDHKIQTKVTTFFQRAIPLLEKDRGLRCTGFQVGMAANPAQFHVTLLMLRLTTPEEEGRAAQLLAQLQSTIYDILGTRSLLLRVKGLDIMEVDAGDAHVLYANIREDGEEGRLAELYNRLQEEFNQAGLLAEPPNPKPIFHATLFNDKNVGRVGFSAASLLQSPIRSFDFGIHRAPSIQLSIRGKYEASGYWQSLAQVVLP